MFAFFTATTNRSFPACPNHNALTFPLTSKRKERKKANCKVKPRASGPFLASFVRRRMLPFPVIHRFQKKKEFPLHWHNSCLSEPTVNIGHGCEEMIAVCSAFGTDQNNTAQVFDLGNALAENEIRFCARGSLSIGQNYTARMNRSYKYRWNIFRQKMELIKETPLT